MSNKRNSNLNIDQLQDINQNQQQADKAKTISSYKNIFDSLPSFSNDNSKYQPSGSDP